MKKLLRHKANFDILEGFLSELLEEEITIKQILDSESNKETEDDKFNRVDILVENSKNELVIIEVQNSKEHDYFHRMLFGTSKAITEHIREGRPYADVKWRKTQKNTSNTSEICVISPANNIQKWRMRRI